MIVSLDNREPDPHPWEPYLPDGVVIERKTPGDLADVITAARGIHESAVVGTVAAWSTRFCPIIFAGSVPSAAAIAFSALRSQVRDIQRNAKALSKKD
jgi:NaMN:DMB phosphoribosyltransferase